MSKHKNNQKQIKVSTKWTDDKVNFIEKYFLIKDKDNNKHHIKLKDYQIKFIKLLERIESKR